MTVDKNAPDNVLALTMSGAVTESDIAEYKAAMERKLAGSGRIGIVVDVSGMTDMTETAMIKGAGVDMEALTHLDRFGRCAFVSDKEWPRALADLFGRFLPGLEMKAFGTADRRRALDWAAATSAAPRAQGGAIRFPEPPTDGVLVFEIDGAITAEEMPDVIARFEKEMASHDRLHLMCRWRSFGGVDPAVFLNGGLLSMKLAALDKVDRYAVVGAPGWLAKAVEAMNPAFPDIDMRAFPADAEEKALAWLRG